MKQKLVNDHLRDTILLLQKKRSDELLLLKEQMNITYESLKPINLIKSTFQDIIQASEFKNSMLKNLIHFTANCLSNDAISITALNSPIDGEHQKLNGMKIIFNGIFTLKISKTNQSVL